uniref:Uncharacterized protein n=1 Tax=Globisporangium ultimum (strain ATCC 200006 / CBS 805.95 / DAOM BR144) TaxID=431595 RepID=K3WHD3_GLOUD
MTLEKGREFLQELDIHVDFVEPFHLLSPTQEVTSKNSTGERLPMETESKAHSLMSNNEVGIASISRTTLGMSSRRISYACMTWRRRAPS